MNSLWSSDFQDRAIAPSDFLFPDCSINTKFSSGEYLSEAEDVSMSFMGYQSDFWSSVEGRVPLEYCGDAQAEHREYTVSESTPLDPKSCLEGAHQATFQRNFSQSLGLTLIQGLAFSAANKPLKQDKVVPEDTKIVLGRKRELQPQDSDEGIVSQKRQTCKKLTQTIQDLLSEKFHYKLTSGITWQNCEKRLAYGGSIDISSQQPDMLYLQIPNISMNSQGQLYAVMVFNHKSLRRGLYGLEQFIKGAQSSKSQSVIDALNLILSNVFRQTNNLLKLPDSAKLYQVMDGEHRLIIPLGASKKLHNHSVILTNSVSINNMSERTGQTCIEFVDQGFKSLRDSIKGLVDNDCEIQKLPSFMSLLVAEVTNEAPFQSNQKRLIQSQNITDPQLHSVLTKCKNAPKYMGAKLCPTSGMQVHCAFQNFKDKDSDLLDSHVTLCRMMLINIRVSDAAGLLFMRFDEHFEQRWRYLRFKKTPNSLNNIKGYVEGILAKLANQKSVQINLDESMASINHTDNISELKLMPNLCFPIPDIGFSWVANTSNIYEHAFFLKINGMDKYFTSTKVWEDVDQLELPFCSCLIVYKKDTDTALASDLTHKNVCDTAVLCRPLKLF